MTTTIDNKKWIEDLANEVGQEVEKLVEAAPVASAISPERGTLLQAIDVRKHMDGLYNQKTDILITGDKDVFIGDIQAGTRVESLSHLKRVVNEVRDIVIHDDYVGEGVYLSAKLSNNYVGKIREVRLKDLSEQQLTTVKVVRMTGVIAMSMPGDSFYTDEPFGVLSGKEVDQVYGRLYFRIDQTSGMLISVNVGPDASALPVQDMEHEYVKIITI